MRMLMFDYFNLLFRSFSANIGYGILATGVIAQIVKLKGKQDVSQISLLDVFTRTLATYLVLVGFVQKNDSELVIAIMPMVISVTIYWIYIAYKKIMNLKKL